MAQTTCAPQTTDVLIIGAGMSGIGFAVQLLKQFGTRNFTIIEKSDNLGGTWWANSYPGCGCDVSLWSGSIWALTKLIPGPISLFLIFFCFKPQLDSKIRSAIRNP